MKWHEPASLMNPDTGIREDAGFRLPSIPIRPRIG